MESVLKSSLFEAFASASEYVYIYVCDMQTGMSRWSLNSVEYFGLPGEYFENAGEIWGMEHVHPDDREAYFADIGAVFTGESSRHSCQYRAKNRYGEYVWMECKGTAIRDMQGGLAVFAGMMTRLDSQNKYDTLTGLLTGNEFYNYDLTGKKGIAILLGVDDFRQVISIFGYSFGDRILVELARGIAALCGEGQMLYRFTGDEFMLFLPDADRGEAEELFGRIRQTAKEVSLEDGRRVELSVSAGAVEYFPGGSRDTLINHLELSLEYIKRQQKGRMLFYCQDIEEKHMRMTVLKEDLKRSIKNHFQGFELYFQPWVDGSGSRILGCEALLRWKGEQIQDAGPVEFIPVLEDDGDIVPVGHWVMEQAMKQQKLWQDRYGDFKVSFNVSYQQFLEENYVEELVSMAQKYGIEPSHMVLELTESCKVDNPENLAAVFQALREKGFLIALDDFGTAYASMELLKKLPADCIKIEHSFVRELEKTGHEIDISIIEALLFLCRKLGCKSVVEGVENRGVDEIIRTMDATYLQGYYYSRPICQADFEAMLNENRKQQGV